MVKYILEVYKAKAVKLESNRDLEVIEAVRRQQAHGVLWGTHVWPPVHPGSLWFSLLSPTLLNEELEAY